MSTFATPRHVEKLDQCYFYHTMDLPEIGTVRGNWDLRGNVGTYLGDYDFNGKRALDVGCASGMLSQFMVGNQQAGADVVSYDLDKSGDWDLIPFAKWDWYENSSNERKAMIDRLNNAYWLGHRLTKSKAKVVYGVVYAIPDAIGPVDVAVFGAILLHLRDPFLALQNGLKLAKETAIVTGSLRSPIPNPHVEPASTLLSRLKLQRKRRLPPPLPRSCVFCQTFGPSSRKIHGGTSRQHGLSGRSACWALKMRLSPTTRTNTMASTTIYTQSSLIVSTGKRWA